MRNLRNEIEIALNNPARLAPILDQLCACVEACEKYAELEAILRHKEDPNWATDALTALEKLLEET